MREEDGGEDGRQRIVDEAVEKAAREHFVDMQRERLEAEEVGDWLDSAL